MRQFPSLRALLSLAALLALAAHAPRPTNAACLDQLEADPPSFDACRGDVLCFTFIIERKRSRLLPRSFAEGNQTSPRIPRTNSPALLRTTPIPPHPRAQGVFIFFSEAASPDEIDRNLDRMKKPFLCSKYADYGLDGLGFTLLGLVGDGTELCVLGGRPKMSENPDGINRQGDNCTYNALTQYFEVKTLLHRASISSSSLSSSSPPPARHPSSFPVCPFWRSRWYVTRVAYFALSSYPYLCAHEMR